MKLSQHGENLFQLTLWGAFNCYLVREADGLTLIDALMAGRGNDILAAATELGQPIREGGKAARLIAAGDLGRKTGQGFYRWVDGKPRKGQAPEHPDLVGLGRELVQPLVNTCESCVEEGVVASADLADIGVIFGTGFAPFLGGPLQARKDGKA